jgi:zinc D-Ala-D-Ala carboxypeptidase
MHPKHYQLINGAAFEMLPAALVKPRANAVARQLSNAQWLIRRKEDGKFLASAGDDWLHSFQRSSSLEKSLTEFFFANSGISAQENAMQLKKYWHELGLDESYALKHQLDAVNEPDALGFAGFDRYRRPLWMQHDAARAWQQMHNAAQQDKIEMDAISGYRGHAYQMGIFRRKFARGQTLSDVLKVNAAPGYSEHHSGRAIDIGTPGDAPAEESFESTAAFAWLTNYAADFGFRMSYPRNNIHGIIYEPWHWCFVM